MSMREIAKLSGIGLSNIYNYYDCKDDLLANVLNPLLEAMDHLLEKHDSHPKSYTIELFFSEEYQRELMREVMELITRYRKEFQLLFFSIQGSRFNNYQERWIAESTAKGLVYLAKMKVLYPQLATEISPFFMHFSCSWWINMIKEVVQHEELSEDETECFIGEYLRFSTGGWKKLMNVKTDFEKLPDV